MDSDSVGLSRSRVCMICGKSETRNEYHVFIVDIAIDESSLGDIHKIPPRDMPPDLYPSVDVADIDLSAFEETTPDIVLVDFPPINVCALDSILCFFPQHPSSEVLYLELPKSLTPREDGGEVVKKARFDPNPNPNPHRVVYGEYGGMLKKAPHNLVSPKVSPVVIPYGTRFLVFSTEIRMGISPDSPGDQFEIYHPFSESEPPLKDLPNLIIHGDRLGGIYKIYNLETKSFEPLRPYSERSVTLTLKSYSLVGDVFFLRTDLGMFCIDLANPMGGWGCFADGLSITYWHGLRQIHVEENLMKLEGIHVYKNEENENYVSYKSLPKSFIPIPVGKHSRFCACVLTLLDGFNYPRITPCILQMQCVSGVGSYMVLDVVRADLSRFGLKNDEEWAEIIHSFKFCYKRNIGDEYSCYGIFPISI